jgi:hypothetical protein
MGEEKKGLTKKEARKIILRTHALLTVDEGHLLYKLAKECEGDVVEIGSYKGGSTVFLAKGLKEPYKVYAIDPHDAGKYCKNIGKDKVPENTFPVFEKNLIKEKVRDRVVPIVNTSENSVKDWNRKIGLLWIDGNYEYNFVKKDFILWEPFLEIGGVIALHDSSDSRGKMPLCGTKISVIDGPNRIVKKYLFNSTKFGNIKIIDSITCAEKIRDNNLIELMKNKMEIYKFKVPYFFWLDKKIGRIGLIIRKISPKTYFVLNKFNFLKD